MLTGLTVPAAVSTGPALAMPRQVISPHIGWAVSSSTTEATAAMSSPADFCAGVGRCARTITVPASSTSAPAIFVPPMSSAPYTATSHTFREGSGSVTPGDTLTRSDNVV